MSSIVRIIAKKKKVFLMLLLVVVGFAFSAHSVAAAGTYCSLWNGDLFMCIVDSVLYGILKLLAYVLAGIAIITNWAMQPSPITTSGFVQAGWSATRDFANMFFILVLLAIALSYILYDSYGVKRALPKLLLIALLINFSIPIAGVFLDFANIVTSFFLKQVSNTNGFTDAFAQGLGLTNIFNADVLGLEAQNAIAMEDNQFINILFSIGLMIGMIFIFSALALMFLIRTGYVSVLLILLPIALVLSAFPPTSKHFSKWMSKFTQWTMFAPAAAFFLYLSMLVITKTKGAEIAVMSGVSVGGGAPVMENNIAFTLLRYIMAWGLMLMSLTVAQSMGITGASTATAMWSKGTKWARGKAYGAGKTMAAAAGRGVKADEKLEKLASGLQKALPGWAGGGLVASGVRGVASKTKAAMEKQEWLTQQQKAQYEKSNDEELRLEYDVWAKSKLPGSGAKAAQISEILARRGKLNVLDENGVVDKEKTSKMVRQAYGFAKQRKNKGTMEAIMKANPVVYQEIAQEEWEERSRKGELFEDAWDKDTRRLIKGRRKDTGETFEDAKNKAFEKMGSTDFEGLKGTWDKKAVRALLLSGAMGSNHIRMAGTANDHVFINHLSSALDELSNDEIRTLQQKSPSLVSYLTGGRVKDYVKVPQSFKDKIKENEGGGEKRMREGGKEKSTLVDQFGRPFE